MDVEAQCEFASALPPGPVPGLSFEAPGTGWVLAKTASGLVAAKVPEPLFARCLGSSESRFALLEAMRRCASELTGKVEVSRSPLAHEPWRQAAAHDIAFSPKPTLLQVEDVGVLDEGEWLAFEAWAERFEGWQEVDVAGDIHTAFQFEHKVRVAA